MSSKLDHDENRFTHFIGNATSEICNSVACNIRKRSISK